MNEIFGLNSLNFCLTEVEKNRILPAKSHSVNITLDVDTNKMS